MLDEAALGPAARALDGGLLVGARVDERGQLVEGEHDVRAEGVLDLHRALRGEAVQRAVDEALEVHAVLVDVGLALLVHGADVRLGQVGQVHGQHLAKAHALAHHLESARVGVGGPVPVLEGRHSPGLVDDVLAGLQVEMVRVREDRLRAGGAHLLRGQRLDGRLGGHGDERRGGDLTVRRADHARAPVHRVPAGRRLGGVQARVHAEAEVGVHGGGVHVLRC